ncbi:MAG: type II toxin-antitoxin system RelE/ParE family toxin [Coleofasciculaceae cyanobacterium SM2_1_6]|nr:type II toxin-antitoxin system RelE/ParE family toxin [Coleofasciculaceae cyanobacterium SM2_1_6]
MSYLIEYEPEAIADLENLTQVVRQRIIKKINWLGENFDQINPQILTGDLSGLFKLRVGDYRVIYEFDREEEMIFIYRIRHRRQVYD